MSANKRLQNSLFVLTALSSAGYGVMFTVLAEFRDRYGISSTGVGWIVATGFFVGFLAQIGIAPLADRGYAKAFVLGGAALNIIGLVGMTLGKSLVPLIGARFLMGLGAGIGGPAIRRVLILASGNDLGSNLGRLLSFDVGGFTIGPVISALMVARFGLASPFLLVAAGIAFAVLPVIGLKLREEALDTSDQRLAFDLLRSRQIAGAVLVGLALFVMIGGFDTLWAQVMKDLDAKDWIAKGGIAAFAFPMIVLGPVGGRLTQRIGPLRAAAIGLLLGSFFMIAYGWLTVPFIMLVVGFVQGTIDGLTVTGTGMAVASAAPPERQAAAQGLLGGLQTLTGGIAAIGVGWLYGHTTRLTTYLIASATMLVLTGFGVALAGIGPKRTGRPGATR